MCSAQSFLQILRPHIGGESVVAVVGHAHSFDLLLPWNGHEDWTENLLPRDTPFVADAGENSRLHKIAFGKRPFLRGQTTEHDAGILLTQALLDVGTDTIELLAADDRPH